MHIQVLGRKLAPTVNEVSDLVV